MKVDRFLAGAAGCCCCWHLLLLGWGLRKSEDDEAYAFGFIPLFLLTTASYYYYVTRLILVAMHAGEIERPRNQVGLVMLFGIELFANWAEGAYTGHRVFSIGWMAWLLTLYTLVMTGFLLWEARQADTLRATAESPPGPTID